MLIMEERNCKVTCLSLIPTAAFSLYIEMKTAAFACFYTLKNSHVYGHVTFN